MSVAFPEKIPPGTVIDDYYEVTGYIGSGGFADVYSGVQRDTGMHIALKIMKPLTGSAGALSTFERRFLQEAQVAARIRHPNVVTILACRKDMTLHLPDGSRGSFDRLYTVLELLQGRDLEQDLVLNGPMDPRRALALMMPCLDGLARGHALGIVHKDLKPSNLFLTEPGSRVEVLKILDYGIARVGQAQEENQKITRAGQAVFTPQYAAPEYIDGLIATPALDVYQMGLVLSEMLTGKPVVEAETVLSCMMIHARGVDIPDDLRRSVLGPVLARATDKNYKARYADAHAFAEALEALNPAQIPMAPSLRVGAVINPIKETLDPMNQTGRGPVADSGPLPPLYGATDLNRVPVAALGDAHHAPAADGQGRARLPEREPTLKEPPLRVPAAPAEKGGSKGVTVVLLLVGIAGVLLVLGLVVGAAVIALVSGGDSDEEIIADALKACDSGDACLELGRQYAKGQDVTKHQGAAAALFEKSCKGESVEGCKEMAELHLSGAGVSKSAGKAFYWHKQACGLDGKECRKLAGAYLAGKGVDKSEDKGAQLYQMGCDGGEGKACQALGTLYAEGRGVTKNREKAVGLYLRACKEDRLDDCFLLFKQGCDDGQVADCRQFASMYLMGEGVEKNLERAFTLHRLACEKATGEECYEFGLNYDKGRGGVVLDDVKAGQLYQIACDKKDARACTNLGYAYERGLGVIQDLELSAKLYIKSCKMDYALGCNNVGVIYRDGIGVAKDDVKSADFFKKSCDMAHKPGCTNLGFMYDKGTGVKQSDAKAVKLYQEGCDGGNMLGCSNLGVMYEKGRGVGVDINRALELYKKACDGGDENGCKNQSILSGRNGQTL